MEREILFRAKAINRDAESFRTNYKNGDWVYGLVTRLYDERFENLPAEMTNTSGVSCIEVDYKTVGQYTGLIDRNGVKIFEGDIVKVKTISGSFINYVITWFNSDLCWVMQSLKDTSVIFRLQSCWKFEVVGNIHDNPEMLKGEDLKNG